MSQWVDLNTEKMLTPDLDFPYSIQVKQYPGNRESYFAEFIPRQTVTSTQLSGLASPVKNLKHNLPSAE
jgi:hypothetical protein